MKMRRAFTLLEVLLATIILGLGLTGILSAMSQSRRRLLSAARLETAQEVMDLGEMAYPLDDVQDPERDLDVDEVKATDLWEKIAGDDNRLTNEQEDKFKGYTWEREWLNKNEDKEIKRLGNLYVVRVTVKWGDDRRGNHDEDSYITFWRGSSSGSGTKGDTQE